MKILIVFVISILATVSHSRDKSTCSDEPGHRFDCVDNPYAGNVSTCYLGDTPYDCVYNPGNASFDCAWVDKCPEYTDESKVEFPCVLTTCPNHLYTTCANAEYDRDRNVCGEGYTCVVPDPVATQLALDNAKCKPLAELGEPCTPHYLFPYLRQDLDYIFPRCRGEGKYLFCIDADITNEKFYFVGRCSDSDSYDLAVHGKIIGRE